ncbi:MAG: hypothetical protein JW982_16580 [Spirochaetes bacterium]|nr:hypothetical protein [Spirochaetota bacterium]
MCKLIRSVIICMIVIIFPVITTGTKMELINFELEDQFGKIHSTHEYRNAPFIILGCDRKGSDYVEEWGLKIKRILKDLHGHNNIKILGVADLSGIPHFIFPAIKKELPHNVIILIDDRGLFSKSYKFEKNSINILIFDSNGSIIKKYNFKKSTIESGEKVAESLSLITG